MNNNNKLLDFIIKGWHKSLHFSVSLGDTGHTRVFTPRVWHVLGVAIIPVTIVLFSVFSVFAKGVEAPYLSLVVEDKDEKIAELESSLATQQDLLDFKGQKIKVFAHELGSLQARLDRFDSIGERLFQDKYFGQYLAEIDQIEPVGTGDSTVATSATSVFAITTQLASASRRADGVERVMETSLDLLSRTQLNRNLQPHHWPVVHKRTYVSSPHGWRNDPFTKKRRWHSGMDIAGAYNAPIVSSANGMVTFSGYRFGYGVMVEITHSGGLVTRYGHLNKALVRNGQSVKEAEVIGLMGSSGRSTGPHLHFEVLLGEHKVDPQPFIKDGRNNAKMLALSNIQAYDTNRF